MLQKTSIESLQLFSEGYWNLCNEAFDRDVYSAADMQRYRRGNCFTLSEFLCKKLVTYPGVVASGISIEILPSRRNYHVASWFELDDLSGAFRLDLLEETPVPIPGMEKALTDLGQALEDILYFSSNNFVVPFTVQRSARQPFQWPQTENAHEIIFLNTLPGIETLHELARAGGSRHLLTSEEAVNRMLPTLPSR